MTGRMFPILKREFTQAVASKAFIIGTVIGPVLLVATFAAQFLIMAKSGGGMQRIAIVDATGLALGDRIATAVQDKNSNLPAFIQRASYEFEQQTSTSDFDATRTELTKRIMAEELDGFLWLPADALSGEGIRYEGTNATNSMVMAELRASVQRVIQSERLRTQGIDEAKLGDALKPVSFAIAKTGDDGSAGNMIVAKLLAFGMAFAIYIMVIMYGQSIMQSVQEEKRDRVVELIVSSVRARDLLVGKVLGIGGAGVLQMLIWVVAAAVVIAYGATAAVMAGASQGAVDALAQQSLLPSVPLSVGVLFVLYFAGGFFLFATLFAVVGAIVTNMQEAQQFVFPILLPFMLGFFIAMPATDNPNSTVAVAGSLIPFTSPMVMPVRAAISGVDWLQTIASLALLYGTATLIIFLAAKIYRTAIFATGKKPSMGELIRWLRAA